MTVALVVVVASSIIFVFACASFCLWLPPLLPSFPCLPFAFAAFFAREPTPPSRFFSFSSSFFEERRVKCEEFSLLLLPQPCPQCCPPNPGVFLVVLSLCVYGLVDVGLFGWGICFLLPCVLGRSKPVTAFTQICFYFYFFPSRCSFQLSTGLCSLSESGKCGILNELDRFQLERLLDPLDSSCSC